MFWVASTDVIPAAAMNADDFITAWFITWNIVPCIARSENGAKLRPISM